MNIFLSLIISILGLLSTVQTVSAEDTPWYQVELIIFEYTDQTKAKTETWPMDPGSPDVKGAVYLIPTNALPDYIALNREKSPQPLIIEAQDISHQTTTAEADVVKPETTTQGEQAFVLLSAKNLALKTAAKELSQAKDYHVLHHIAWRQPVAAASDAISVLIHSDMENGEQLLEKMRLNQQSASIMNQTNEFTPALDNNAEFPELATDTTDSANLSIAAELDNETNPTTSIAKTRLPIEGLIRVSLSRYLHLGVDLTFSRQISSPLQANANEVSNDNALILVRDTNNDTTEMTAREAELEENTTLQLQAYRLIESRRMRSKEVHYIDHPAFGVVALITPYERVIVKKETPIENIMIGVPQ